MANVIFKQGTGVVATGTLNPAFEAGSLIFAKDTGKIYLDAVVSGADTRIELYNDVFRQARIKENKLQFFYTEAALTDASVADKEVDLISEQFLDTTYTKFEYSFDKDTFEATLPTASATVVVNAPADVDDYAGKTVLALVMKSTENDGAKTTYTYSLVDLGALIDVNKADKIAITATGADDAEKLANAQTHEDEIVTMTVEGDATKGFKGNIKASGKKVAATIRDKDNADDNTIPTEKSVRTELDKKADIIDPAVEDNLIAMDADGNIKDSGVKAGGASFADASQPTVDAEKILATEAAVDAKKADKLTLTAQEVTDGVTLADHENEVVMYDDAGNIKSSGMKVATSVRALTNDTNPTDIADDTTLVTEKAVRSALASAALEWGTF